MLPIFPYSPLPANLTRVLDWGENVVQYDSGESQGGTAFVKPLYDWTVPVKLMTEIKQSSLFHFIKVLTKGQTLPFLLKDAYDFRINSGLAVNSGVTNGATLYIFDNDGFMVRPDTITCGSMFSALSGFVTLGNNYTVQQDTGIVTVNTKAPTDVWGVRSLQYYKKARFMSQYSETSQLWNIFNTQMDIVELP